MYPNLETALKLWPGWAWGWPYPPPQLRPITLGERAVLRLFGSQAPRVADDATRKHPGYTDLAQGLRMVDYFNLLPLN